MKPNNKGKGGPRSGDVKKMTRDNYFTQGVQRNGTDFIDKVRSDQLQNDSTRIFREIVKGKIDIIKSQEYLINDKLGYTLEQQAYNTYIYNTEVYNSINYRIISLQMYGAYVDPYLVSLADEWQKRMFVYQIIAYNVQCFRMTRDVNFIIAMANQIGRNGRYI